MDEPSDHWTVSRMPGQEDENAISISLPSVTLWTQADALDIRKFEHGWVLFCIMNHEDHDTLDD
jgi:hypothetical protein